MMRHGTRERACGVDIPAERSHNESALRLCRLPCCLKDDVHHAVSLFSRLGRPIGVSHDIRVVRRQQRSSLDPVALPTEFKE
jgi:hypothetical protein